MNDAQKTKAQLLKEIASLRQRVQEIEYAPGKNRTSREHSQHSELTASKTTGHSDSRMADETQRYRNLEEYVRRLSRVVEQTADSVIITDHSGIIEYVNPAFEKQTGYSRDEVIGKKPRIIRSGYHDAAYYQDLWNTILNGNVFRSLITNRKKNGELSYEEITVTPIKDEQGNITNFVATNKDVTGRRLTELALMESEHRFKTLADASFEGILLSERGVIIDCNDQLCKMLGYDRSELLWKSLSFIAAPESRKNVEESGLSGSQEPVEYIAKRKTGAFFPIEVRSRNTQVGIRELRLTTVRDITERKLNEAALRNEKAFLDALMDNIPDSIYFKDRECRILRVNRKEMHDLNVTDMNQVIGKTDQELFGEEFGNSTMLSEEQLMSSGEPVIGLIETRKMKGGELIWTSTTKVPLRNDAGEIVGLVGITREINELMKAQEERERERALLRTLIDNLPDYIYIKDTEGRFIVGNNAVVKAFGFSSEERLIGKTDFDLFPHELAKQYKSFEQEIIRSGKGIHDFEGSSFDQSKDIKERWVSTTKVPLRDAQGTVIGTVGIGRDITERKRIEEALRETANKFQFVFENAYDGLSIFEETGERKDRRLVDCNKRYAEMAGRTREELLQWGTTKDISKRISEDHHESNEPNVAFGGSFTWIRPDGKDNVIEYTAVPIQVHGKTITIGIDRDITERKRIEEEREHLIKDLQAALADVKTLSGLVPICANCKQIRDDKGFWMQVESYIQERSDARFSHGICPECMRKLYPEFLINENE